MFCSHTLAGCSECNYSTAWSKRITGRHWKSSGPLSSCVFRQMRTAWRSRDFGVVCPVLYKTFKQGGMVIIIRLRRQKCLKRRPPCCAFLILWAKQSDQQSMVACRQDGPLEPAGSAPAILTRSQLSNSLPSTWRAEVGMQAIKVWVRRQMQR